jgi:RimJ/RimL family protein N-acetyltransferase
MALRVTALFQDRLREWAAPRLGVKPDELALDFEFVGIFDGDQADPLAAVGYNAHFNHYLSIHVVAEKGRRWITPSVCALVFGYAFDHKGVTRINAVVPAHNLPVQILCLKLGFRIEATMRCGAEDGTDGILFSMLRQECRWIPQKETSDGR